MLKGILIYKWTYVLGNLGLNGRKKAEWGRISLIDR